VITKVWNEIEYGPPSAQQTAEAPGILPRAGENGDRLQMLQKEAPDVALSIQPVLPPPALVNPQSVAVAPLLEIAALVARAHRLIFAGDVPNARLVLQQAAEAGNATAALELGMTYDPIELEKWERPISAARRSPVTGFPVASTVPSVGVPRVPFWDPYGNIESKALYDSKALSDIAMAQTWYQKAKDLGSTEAQGRLENLVARDQPKR